MAASAGHTNILEILAENKLFISMKDIKNKGGLTYTQMMEYNAENNGKIILIKLYISTFIYTYF